MNPLGPKPIHGHAMGKKSVEYTAWTRMRGRCGNRNNHKYHRYGGRGIIVCKRWGNFLRFFEDMGVRPSKEHSLDRVNNDGNYEPSNCRWATRQQQALNRSDAMIISYNGVPKNCSVWADELGIKEGTLRMRIKRGWSPERAFFTVIRKVAEEEK